MTRISHKGAANLNSTRWSVWIGVSSFLLALLVFFLAAWCYQNSNIPGAAILVCLLAALFSLSVCLNSKLLKDVEDQRTDSQKALEHLYRDLVKARDEALDAAKSKSAFLANMSHEIRTPMNAVIGCSDMLTRTSLNSEQRKLVDIILSSGSALVDIINDILVLSKLEAGKFDLQQEEIEIVTLVERTADLLAEKAESKQLSLTTFVAPEATSVVIGDAHRLRQILLNLLSNAVKFTEHGCIALRAELDKTEEDSIWIKFSVSDTGIGIAEENLGRLFKPFSQCDVSVTRRYGGTGLGLVISKKLAEVMGGKLSVRSELAVGSTFTATIPFKLAQTQPEVSNTGVLNGKRMLVVGTPFNEFEVIRNYGFVWDMACDYAPSGETAIRYIDLSASSSKSFQYDVVLCNDDLCDWDTQTFAANVRARDRHIKTVMLSGLSGVDRAFELSLEGISATVSKPLHQSALLECILELFQKKSDTTDHAKFAPELLNKFSQALPQDACKRILVVEDNPVNQEVATLQLRELGFIPLIAENGAEALKILAKTRVSLILMDCQMPIMDGFETSRRIRKAEKGGQFRVPIIAMTANAMEGDRQNCLGSGMDDYVTKPLTSRMLRELIEKYLLVALEDPAENEEMKTRPVAQ